ncbi:MAG: hypothetical protein ABEJ85_04005, partial [Haloarculaceae archaeon]
MTDDPDGADDGEPDPQPGVPEVQETDDPSVPTAEGVGVDRPATESGTIPGDQVGPVDEEYRYDDGSGRTGGDEGAAGEASHEYDGACGCGDSCGCEDDGPSESTTAGSRAPRPAADGGTTPANVTDDGELRDVEFTKPAEGKSQDVYE